LPGEAGRLVEVVRAGDGERGGVRWRGGGQAERQRQQGAERDEQGLSVREHAACPPGVAAWPRSGEARPAAGGAANDARRGAVGAGAPPALCQTAARGSRRRGHAQARGYRAHLSSLRRVGGARAGGLAARERAFEATLGYWTAATPAGGDRKYRKALDGQGLGRLDRCAPLRDGDRPRHVAGARAEAEREAAEAAKPAGPAELQ